MASLIIQDDKGQIQQMKVGEEPITIGRREDNKLMLQDMFISRYHGRIEKRGEIVQIVDLGSTYGTIVNGRKITGTVELHFGDVIKLGNSTVTFMEEGAVEVPDAIAAPPEESLVFAQINQMDDEIKALSRLVPPGAEAEWKSKIAFLEKLVQKTRDNFIELEHSAQIASTLYEVGKVINFVFDLDLLLSMTMDMALKVMQAERGFMMLKSEKTGELTMRVARNMEKGGWEEMQTISKTIIFEVFSSGSAILTDDAQQDSRFSEQASVVMHKIRSVMCVPMKTKEQKVIGVIYIDSRKPTWLFSDSGLGFLSAFASQAAVAIENASLHQKVLREERVRGNLQRYLSQPLVEQIMKDKGSLSLGGEQKIITIIFADIRGFTTMSEKMRPADVVELLNSYFTIQTEEIFKEGGTLDKYVGDAIMAVFGAPIEFEDHALRAVRAALGMQRGLAQFKKNWMGKGESMDKVIEGFQIGIGINTGPAIAGNIGSEKRMEYTVIGDTVNTSSRLEGVARKGEIIISSSTYAVIQDQIEVKALAPVKLKGKSEPLQVYEVLGLKESKEQGAEDKA